MITQTARVDTGGNEIVPERIHHRDGRHFGGVAVIVRELALGQLGAGRGFDGDIVGLGAFRQRLMNKRERAAREVGPAAVAADDNIRVFVNQLKLFFGFKTNNGLVQNHVVQYAAERIMRILSHRGVFHGFGYCDAEAAKRMRVFGEYGAPRVG